MNARRTRRTNEQRQPAPQPGSLFAWVTSPIVVATVVIASTVLIVYAQTIAFPFCDFDDDLHVTNNPVLLRLGWSDLAHFWTTGYEGVYFPLSYTLFSAETWLSRALTGTPFPAPGLFHAGNVLLHLLNSLLVFSLLRRLKLTTAGAVCGALLFAVHPLQVESVAWISEQRGLLAASFGLAALNRYLAVTDRSCAGTGVAWWHWLGPLLLYSASLLAKSSTVTLPLIAACLVIFRETQSPTTTPLLTRVRSLVWPLAYWLIPAAIAALIQKQLQADTALDFTPTPLSARPLVAIDALGFYLMKLVYPWPLAIDYGRTPGWVLESGQFYGTGLGLAAVLLALWFAPPRGRWWMALGIFVLALLPVLGLVNFLFQNYSTTADRYTYLALLGPALALGTAVTLWPSTWVVRGASVAIIGWCVLSFAQTRNWRDNITLYAHAEQVNPRSSMMSNNLGNMLSEAGRHDEAIAAYRRAIALDPRHEFALTNLGSELMTEQKFDEAIELFRRAIEVRPERASPLVNWGLALERQGKRPEAAEKFREAVARQPDYAPARLNLGRLLLADGDLKTAQEQFETYVQLQPLDARGAIYCAQVYLRQNDYRAALGMFVRASELDPDFIESQVWTAHCLNRLGRSQEALIVLEQFFQREPRDDTAHLEAAQAWSQLGGLQRAIQHCQAALAINPQNAAARQMLETVRGKLQPAGL